ncbi:Hypothetical protein PHPALM_6134 [Phytophthora palmivora]|uniref:CCHC-type domain-containing protein n=1 Tax=Phytophthora palmivora TaxID=4796 RepID=A0A2P4YFK8_9STRA|nr:Hypothetical protein PHPALM_6134 [Phytophthora palmivora]
MPTFSGLPEESVDGFMFAAKLFMQGKNIDYTSPANSGRVMAMLATNLRGDAASWYHTRVAIDHRPKCKQTGKIDDYVAQFRRLTAQVREMSQLDQIDHFCEGLKAETRKEVSYLQCKTLSEAISHAQAFERTHFSLGKTHDSHTRRPITENVPEPMDITAVNSPEISKGMCRQHNLCFYCKASGHRIRDCSKKPQGNGPAQRM